MGSWNATCAVTQLPILAKTPVVMVPLIVKPDDYLARDNMGGHGPSAHDHMAQPLSLPLRGTYNDDGSLDLSKDDVGLLFLKTTLAAFVKQQRLHAIKEGEPVVCKKLPTDFLELLMQGELMVTTDNPRKAWLQELHQLYKDTPNKRSLAHYKAQLKVDPATLPDTLPMPLAINFIPTTLYDALTRRAGQSESMDRFDEKTNKLVSFKGTREKQLNSDLTLASDVKHKYDLLLASVQDDPQEPAFKSLATESAEQLATLMKGLTYAFLRQAKPGLFDLAREIYFSAEGAVDAIIAATVKNDNAIRQELVKFTLFDASMDRMRKQWVPQTGTGSSASLGDALSRDLYQLAGNFVVSQCDLSSPGMGR